MTTDSATWAWPRSNVDAPAAGQASLVGPTIVPGLGSVPDPEVAPELEAFDRLDALMHRRRGSAPRGAHRMRALCHELGDPQRELATIHVVGTDGKTSIVRIAASLLTALGLGCGETTSPHLQDVTERVRIDGHELTREQLLAGFDRLEPAIERAEHALGEPITFFEAITALALRRFADDPVDAAIVEAGIGGTGDATNVLDSRVAVLSLVGLDHAELGDTLAEVAAEKAGIVVPGGQLIAAAQRPEVTATIERVVAERGGHLLLAGRDLGVLTRRSMPGGQEVGLRGLDGSYLRGRLPLAGAHQAANAAVALAAVQSFLGTTDLDPDSLRAGLASVRVPGRVEVVRSPSAPPIVLDGAHDREASRALVAAVRGTFGPSGVTVVMGISGGRDPAPLLAELATLDPHLIVTRASSPTSTPVDELLDRVREAGFEATRAADPIAALREARWRTPPGGCLVVTGSLHLAGEVRGLLQAACADEVDQREDPLSSAG